MKKLLLTSLIFAAASTAGAQSLGSGLGLRGTELGFSTGVASGFSGEIFVHRPNVFGPFGLKASAAFTRPSDSISDSVAVSPALGINETFGSYKSKGLASESGSHTVLGLDGTYNLGEISPGISALAYAGPRYGMFKASETFSGSTTDYKMNSFGIGAGAQLSYALAGNISLVGDLGIDHFFNSGITASGSNNTNQTIGTGDADYSSYRNRIVFPGNTFKAKIGVKFSF